MALKLKTIDFDGISVKIKTCKPPSDIIWLNRGVSKGEQCKRGLLATLILLIGTLVVYFLFSSEVSAQIYIKYRAYPPGVACSSLIEAYGIENIGIMAGIEYTFLKATKHDGIDSLTARISHTGSLPCFCTHMVKDENFSRDHEFTIKTRMGEANVAICQDQMAFYPIFGLYYWV